MQIQKNVQTAKVSTRDLLEQAHSCCLCGTKLVFRHKTDFINQKVTEEANCPACKIRTKALEFRLQ